MASINPRSTGQEDDQPLADSSPSSAKCLGSSKRKLAASAHAAGNQENPNDTRDEIESNEQCLQLGVMKLDERPKRHKEMQQGRGELRFLDVGVFMVGWDSAAENGQSSAARSSTARTVAELQETPYLAETLKDDLEKVKTILQTMEELNTGGTSPSVSLPVSLSPEAFAISPELTQLIQSNPELTQFMKSQAALTQSLQSQAALAESQTALTEIKLGLTNILNSIEKSTRNVNTQLLVLSGLSQTEGTVTETATRTTDNAPPAAKSPKTGGSETAGLNSRGFRVAEPQIIYDRLFEEPEKIEKVIPGLGKATQNQKAEGRLWEVSKCFQEFLERATFLADNEPNYKETIQKGIKGLNEEIQMRLNGLNTNGTSDVASGLFAPGPVANEKVGTQPFFQLLLKTIAMCWETPASASPARGYPCKELSASEPPTKDCALREAESPPKNCALREAESPPKACVRSEAKASDLKSPPKGYARREAPVPSTGRKRTIDFLLQKEGRWNAVIFDDTLTVPLEVKPGCRKGQGLEKLWTEARDQILSHLAKHLHVGFHFAGYGVPCHATGIVANMAAIQIFQLRYEDVGQVSAKLKLYQSKRLPLMNVKAFRRWAALAKKRHKEFLALEEDLYGSKRDLGMYTECASLGKEGVPLGAFWLFSLINQPSSKLFGLSVAATSDVLGDHLGTGATAVVFRRVDADRKKLNSVFKLSRYGFKTDIKNELKFLKALAGNGKKDSCKNIPNIVSGTVFVDKDNDGSFLEVTLGSVVTALPAIELSPAGKNASSMFSSSEFANSESLLSIVLQGISSALKHMHSMGICHCDVSPKNIIIANSRRADERAVLIDYAIASRDDEAILGFRGTPNYAHRGIFKSTLLNVNWQPSSQHDKAGLGFSLAYFANRCIRSWDVDDFPRVSQSGKLKEGEARLKSVMDTRLQRAYEAVANSAYVANQTKAEINNLLKCDNDCV